MAVKPIPDGYHTATPYFVAKDAEQLLTFLKDAFAARNRTSPAPKTDRSGTPT